MIKHKAYHSLFGEAEISVIRLPTTQCGARTAAAGYQSSVQSEAIVTPTVQFYQPVFILNTEGKGSPLSYTHTLNIYVVTLW